MIVPREKRLVDRRLLCEHGTCREEIKRRRCENVFPMYLCLQIGAEDQVAGGGGVDQG
jgi:hypothetical protein